VYALAPETLPASEANRLFNALIADQGLPLTVFHDHFVGRPGAFAILYVRSPAEREALLGHKHLAGWRVEIHPLVFSHSPAGFEDQINFTLRAYRGLDWELLQRETMPEASGGPGEGGAGR
jgi:hypothetical protein